MKDKQRRAMFAKLNSPRAAPMRPQIIKNDARYNPQLFGGNKKYVVEANGRSNYFDSYKEAKIASEFHNKPIVKLEENTPKRQDFSKEGENVIDKKTGDIYFKPSDERRPISVERKDSKYVTTATPEEREKVAPYFNKDSTERYWEDKAKERRFARAQTYKKPSEKKLRENTKRDEEQRGHEASYY